MIMRPPKSIRIRTLWFLVVLQFSVWTTTISHAKLHYNVVSYTAMLGLGAQSSKWKLAMEQELTQVAQHQAKAAAWQEAATSDEAASEALVDKSMAEKEEAALLQDEADALLVKGQADEAQAATTEEEADGMTEQAAELEGESTTLFAQAAAEETLAEEDIVKATADAALAAEDGVEAEADEAGTAICQFIPFVDFFCDVLGGIAAVGLESQAVRSAAKAAEEYATAAAAQVEVKAATTEATELQTTALEQGGEAGTLHSRAAELEVKAAEEIDEGEADKAEAEAEVGESVADQEAAAEEETKATTEEEASAKAWSESVQHGASACGNAIMVTMASMAAMLFWTLRIAGGVILPVLKSGLKYTWSLVAKRASHVGSENVSPSTSTSFNAVLVAVSHIFHHGFMFVIFFGLWGDALLQLRSLGSVQSMGGIILGFAASQVATHIVLLHSLPKAYQHEGGFQASLLVGLYEFARRSVVLCPLVVMELLLLWVNAGNWIFSPNVVQGTQAWWLWFVLAGTTVTHYVYVARSKNRVAQTNITEAETASLWGCHILVEDNETCDSTISASSESLARLCDQAYEYEAAVAAKDYGSRGITHEEEIHRPEDWEAIEDPTETIEDPTETMALLSYLSHDTDAISITKNASEKSFISLVIEDIKLVRLVLVFEILMASIMLALLRQSTPALRSLWPASRAILLSMYPHWHWIIALSGAVVVLVLLCACI